MGVLPVQAGVRPGGPVFVSYRQSDGTAVAVDLAWLLRAAGVPVWQDVTDLPPGDSQRRLDEALRSGLSGAVLLVTPEISNSGVVRHQELPALLSLSGEDHPDFVLAVASTIVKPNGKLDYEAPDRLLEQPRILGGLKQYNVAGRDGQVALVQAIAAFRADRIAASRPASAPVHVSLQTRGRPGRRVQGSADLPIVLRSAASGRLPDRDAALDLQSMLPSLPDTVSRSGASAVRITGGAHLSVAFAVGAALPAALISQMTVEDRDGAPWTCGPVSTGGPGGLVHRVTGGVAPLPTTGTARSVVAFVELLPDTSEAAYTRFLTEHPDITAWEYLRATAPGRLDPTSAGPLIEEVAARLRALAQRHSNATLHLLLRCPFPVAVLLGRLCNTLRCVTYEWDDTAIPGDPDHRARYIPSLAVAAGLADGPITEVLLPGTTAAGRTA